MMKLLKNNIWVNSPSILQGWMACFVNAGWMNHQKMYDHAQEGGLLYPIGLIGVDYPGK